jgi:hypothetical protein
LDSWQGAPAGIIPHARRAQIFFAAIDTRPGLAYNFSRRDDWEVMNESSNSNFAG